jgi:hypothetical protein
MVRRDMLASNQTINRSPLFHRNLIFPQCLVETNACSEQNAPSQDHHDSGEVAERLNGL